MSFELTTTQIEAADRAMSSMSVMGFSSLVFLLLTMGALIWASIMIYGTMVDANERRIDFGGIASMFIVITAVLIVVGGFVNLT